MSSLDVTRVSSRLAGKPGLWRDIRAVAETGSTNTDVLALARSGEPEGLVLAAERQTAGRGRLGREWVSPPGTGLTFSVLLRPAPVPASLLGWVPLLAGLAASAAVAEVAAANTRLKWPNDLLAGGAKLAGILAEGGNGAVVVGLGINVSQRPAELPGPGATSLLVLAGARERAAGAPGGGDAGAPGPGGDPGRTGLVVPGREELLAAVLGELARWYLAWRDQAAPGDAGACGLRAEYLLRSATVGREVTVTLPGGRVLAGLACGVDELGRLELRSGGAVQAVSAGDVVHVR
jgi:BirA family transcriptional regulator, biotin operon repressor / biotin---[acetyl-CoA-carboxylase] ligase